MAKVYKVWMQIEMCDEEYDRYENMPWPEELFATPSRAKAFKQMDKFLDILREKDEVK